MPWPTPSSRCARPVLPPALAQWQQLAPFQRYVLMKLSRKPTLNHDFVPAMREFGLAAAR